MPRIVRTAAQHWQLVSGRLDVCPSLRDLVADGSLDRDWTDDLVAHSVQITCLSEDIVVLWSGPDGLWGTKDDERAPRGESAK